MYDKSVWLFDLHNLFKSRDGLSGEQSYRRIIDNIKDFDEAFNGGITPQEAYEEFWS